MSPATLTRNCQLGSPLVAALEAAWSAIQQRHPEVPDAVIITGSGTDSRSVRWGHYARGAWRNGGDDELPEIFMSGEGFERGAVPTLGTLIHEAAHAVATVRGVQDVSRQGRYHNRRFKAIAEDMGLSIEKAPGIGWSVTTVPDETAADYAEVVAALDAALTLVRRPSPKGSANGGGSSTLACVCGCQRKVRVSRSTLQLGPITCGVCDEPFRPEATS